MEFQSFEEMLEYAVNVKEAIMSEEINQVMQTVYFPTYSDRRLVSSNESRKSMEIIFVGRFIRSRPRTLSCFGFG